MREEQVIAQCYIRRSVKWFEVNVQIKHLQTMFLLFFLKKIGTEKRDEDFAPVYIYPVEEI